MRFAACRKAKKCAPGKEGALQSAAARLRAKPLNGSQSGIHIRFGIGKAKGKPHGAPRKSAQRFVRGRGTVKPAPGKNAKLAFQTKSGFGVVQPGKINRKHPHPAGKIFGAAKNSAGNAFQPA